MADMFADNQLKSMINKIIDNFNWEEDELKRDTTPFKRKARLMFHNYPAIQVFNLVYEALEEASDEQWFEKKYPRGFFKETFVFPKKKKSVIKINLKRSRNKKLINDNINITDVAKSYGLKVKKNKCICPFHADSQPSLGFDDERNIFHCFGCNAKEDVIEFERRMKCLRG